MKSKRKSESPIVPASWERQVREQLCLAMRYRRGQYLLSWQGKGYVGKDPEEVCDAAIKDMNESKQVDR